MTDRPEQRPEGLLIATAQKRARLSNREAASRVPMSEGHWRAIVSNSRSMGKGLWVPVHGPADTLARMAQVVGVTPEQLQEAGRGDAAEELRSLPPLPDGSDVDPVEARIRALEARVAANEAEVAQLRAENAALRTERSETA